jgi:vesicle coat complex subunit
MLIMTSTIRVGQSKFVTTPIDEDSQERILNCVQTLSDAKEKDSVNNIFLEDTKAAYAKMVATEEVRCRNIEIKTQVQWLTYLCRKRRQRNVKRNLKRRLCRSMMFSASGSSLRSRLWMVQTTCVNIRCQCFLN